MRRIILIMSVIVVALASCGGGNRVDSGIFDPVKQTATDESVIQAYIKQNHIDTKKGPSGLYYQILKEGTGANANQNSTVKVNYEGKMTDGTVFDSTPAGQPASFPLGNVIQGWTMGIPLVKAGGKILLLIPSALGYGEQGGGPIPPNTVLIFTIDVLSVQ